MASTENVDELVSLLTSGALDINKSTTRANARKQIRNVNKDPDQESICICTTCFRRFEGKKDLTKHLKKNDDHRADKEALKEDFKETKQELSENPDSKVAESNYKLALFRMTLLVKLGRSPE